jgi:hypothetical protein
MPVPAGCEAGWAAELIGMFWRRENSLASFGIQTTNCLPHSLVVHCHSINTSGGTASQHSDKW